MRLVLLLLALLFASSAQARTWTVEKDGSGDFSLLQPAADSAAPGDTILIGPGRWEEVTEFYFNSGLRRDAHLVVRVDNLTIMGTSNEDVIIGPTVLNDLGGYPVGVVIAQDVVTTRIESLRVENLRRGIYSLGSMTIKDCVAFACQDGFVAEGPLDIVGSRAESCSNDGIMIIAGASRIAYCEILACTKGISLIRPNGRSDIVATTVENCRVGIQFDQTLGTLQQCVVRGSQIVGVWVNMGSSVEMTDCELDNNGRHIDFGNLSSFLGVSNRLGRFERYGIWIANLGEFVWTGNDFLYASQYQVYVTGPLCCDPVHYDFTGNYWGTADSNAIADNIYDLNDDINVRAIIDFSPFAEEPVPVEGSSMGGLKSKFRTR